MCTRFVVVVVVKAMLSDDLESVPEVNLAGLEPACPRKQHEGSPLPHMSSTIWSNVAQGLHDKSMQPSNVPDTGAQYHA